MALSAEVAHPIISITAVRAPTSVYTFSRLHLFCVCAAQFSQTCLLRDDW